MARRVGTAQFGSRLATLASTLTLIGACTTSQVDAGAAPVDLELILAVDVSDSVSRRELLVQRRGYVAALRSPEVAAVIVSGGAVALAYIEWAGPRSQKIVIPWTVLADGKDAAGFADRLAAAPLRPDFTAPPWERGTSISEALVFAAGMFTSRHGIRRIIDVSGNGPQNIGGDLFAARAMVVAKGITINGLPLDLRRPSEGPPLGSYYGESVIGGSGAFAISVDDPSLFEASIRRKLALEIAGPPPRPTHAGYRPTPGAATAWGPAVLTPASARPFERRAPRP